MAIYRFKVTFEESDELYRIIEIQSFQTFEDFHRCIQQAIGFDNSKPASFFMSDDYWRKGTEITLKESETDPGFDPRLKPKRLMRKSKLADFIEDPHQKMLYLSDFEAQWNFTIELVRIIIDQHTPGTYPQCVKSSGTAPRQYKTVALPPPAEDEEEEHHPEKIFHHEEGLDDEEDEALPGEEGEEAETEGEESEAGGESEAEETNPELE